MTNVVVMDTSALMAPVECDVRVFEELDRLVDDAADLLVPEPVVAELRKLADGGGEEATAASVGLDLATERCRAVPTDESYADDAVCELAESADADFVVTNDRALRDRLLERKVRVVGVRGRNTLAITEP